jgi:hypothetical protein
MREHDDQGPSPVQRGSRRLRGLLCTAALALLGIAGAGALATVATVAFAGLAFGLSARGAIRNSGCGTSTTSVTPLRTTASSPRSADSLTDEASGRHHARSRRNDCEDRQRSLKVLGCGW